MARLARSPKSETRLGLEINRDARARPALLRISLRDLYFSRGDLIHQGRSKQRIEREMWSALIRAAAGIGALIGLKHGELSVAHGVCRCIGRANTN